MMDPSFTVRGEIVMFKKINKLYYIRLKNLMWIIPQYSSVLIVLML